MLLSEWCVRFQAGMLARLHGTASWCRCKWRAHFGAGMLVPLQGAASGCCPQGARFFFNANELVRFLERMPWSFWRFCFKHKKSCMFAFWTFAQAEVAVVGRIGFCPSYKPIVQHTNVQFFPWGTACAQKGAADMTVLHDMSSLQLHAKHEVLLHHPVEGEGGSKWNISFADTPPTYTYTIKITSSIDKRLEVMDIVLCMRISSEYTYIIYKYDNIW